MKRLLCLIIGSTLILTACGKYEGIVAEKTDSSFMLEVTSDDFGAEPAKHKMHLTDHTIFSGTVRTFDDLKEGDHVVVVPFETSPDLPYIFVSEVIAE